MTTVFLSYSTKDHYFADLADIKLKEADILLWRDQGQLRAGGDWRNGIEQGIADSIAVLVAVSQNSSESPYVTFEWAYGLGKAKTVVPIRLESCKVHPRLETIQYLDFSVPGSLPWNLLIQRIREIEAEATPDDELAAASTVQTTAPLDPMVNAILRYLDQRGYQMVSYERVRKSIIPSLTDDQLDTLVKSNLTFLRPAVLKGSKRGVAKRLP